MLFFARRAERRAIERSAEAGRTIRVRREDEKKNHQNSKQVFARCPLSPHDVKGKKPCLDAPMEVARCRIGPIVLKWAAGDQDCWMAV